MMQHTVQITGDGLQGEWITWRWSNKRWPLGVAKTTGLKTVLRAFRSVLPNGTDHMALYNSLHGALVRLDEETALMRRLSEALLPAALRRQLRECADSGARLLVQVAPSPPAAAVPWGLLFVDEKTRLLEIAEVSWIAPPLLRDLGRAPDPSSWDDARSLPPLHVIDPDLSNSREGQILPDPCDAALITEDEETKGQCEITREALSADLQKPRSRFYFLGHCSSKTDITGSQADLMGMILSDIHGGRQHPLTAADLITHPSQWPMPPRAAVVACASGIDMADFEPFGLATGLLSNGASLVQATLWTLPTDHALSWRGSTGRPFLRLAQAVEKAQRADDPIAHLHTWQREQLAAWRDHPGLGTSPLWWGSAMTMTAPLRQIEA